MTTTAQKYDATKPKVTPTTSDEEQKTTGDTQHKVLVNDCKFTIRTDRRTSFIGNKLWGHGIHVFHNGDINIQAGPKRWGNGKLVTVSRGGQIVKTGPCCVERNGYRKSFLQEDVEDDQIIAYEETNTGNVTQTTDGTLTINATNIKIEAADTLELIAGDQIILQSKGRINQNTGAYVSTFDTKKEEGTTKAEIKVPQRIMTSNDPRSSDDIVIAGHVNRRFGGDYRVEAGGISATYIMGNKALPGVPLVLNRSVGLHIGLDAPSAGFGGINIESKAGTVDLKAGVDLKLAAGALFNLTTGGLTNFASGGDINMSSPKGIGIAAGVAMPSLGVGDVKIRAVKDVDILATVNAKLRGRVEVEISNDTGAKIELIGAIIKLN